MFGRTRKDAPPTDAANENQATTPPTNPPTGEQENADATSADGAADAAASAAPNSPPDDKAFDDRVEKRVREILAKERETEERTAAERAAHEAWIGRHAPKMAGTEFAKVLFGGLKTDEQRQARAQMFIDWAKSAGVRAPDLGATPEREGGRAIAVGDDPKSDRIAAANKAADEIGTRRL